jgi:hypothetical protein
VLVQQTAKYLLDLIQAKFKGKDEKTRFMDWVSTTPVEGSQNEAKSLEEFLCDDNLLAIFTHRTNLLLQRSAMRLQGKLSDKKTHPLDAWNDSQVFYLNSLSKAYGEHFGVMMFHRFLQRLKSGEVKTNDDTKECFQILY